MNDKEELMYTTKGTFRKGPDNNWTPVTNVEYGLPELTVTSSRPIQTGDFKNKSKLIKEMGGEKSETLAHRVVNGLGLELTYPEFDVLGLTYGMGLGTRSLNALTNYSDNVLRRGVEIAMRTTPEQNPIPVINSNLKTLLNNKLGGYKRLYNIGKYILLNKKSKIPGYSNSLALYYPNNNKINYYTGFLQKKYNKNYSEEINYLGKGNDIIDALLYNKTINPSYGWRVSKSKSLGPHKEYAKVNGDKYINAPIYKEINGDYIDNPQNIGNWVSSENPESTKNIWPDIFAEHSDIYPDVGGHLIQFGKSPINNTLFARGQDIYKFNYKDYIKSYPEILNNSKQRPFIKLGLKTVDKLTHPIIFRTPWKYIKDI